MSAFVRQHPGLDFAAYVVLFWAMISCTASLAGGWWKLSQQYRTERPFPAHYRAMQKGQMRFGTRYKAS
jgi:hypothetical protein